MDHCSMMLALAYLAESGPAESGEVAESLKIKQKHASMVLLARAQSPRHALKLSIRLQRENPSFPGCKLAYQGNNMMKNLHAKMFIPIPVDGQVKRSANERLPSLSSVLFQCRLLKH